MTTVPADLIGAQAQPPAPKPAEPAAPPKAHEASPAQAAQDSERLLIQEGAQAGVFVYTILDRASGRVLAQIPRTEVVQLAARPDYSAGQVISTKA